MINLELTLEQALLVKAALIAEIRKGAGTFLDYNDVTELHKTLHRLDDLAAQELELLVKE